MDIYLVAKFLHVVAAIAWLGGGLTMLAQTLFSIRDTGEMETIRGLQRVGDMGKRWFIPASLLTLVFGAITTHLGGLWGEAWVTLGLVGAASTFITGMAVFEPKAKLMNRLMAESREAEALVQGRSVLRIAKFDYTIMLLIIADMVLKPTWSDYAVLGTMAVVLLAGAILFLRPTGGKATPRLA